MLDPENWDEFRAQSHRMLDDMVDYIQHIRERPVWQAADDLVRQNFQSPLPVKGSQLCDLHDEFMRYILPYTVGNTHPGFMGWVHGGGTPVGMVAEMLAAGLNANVGGRNQIPLEVERQVVDWMRVLFRFPITASGVLTTGTSAATVIALTTARDAAMDRLDINVQLAAYASSEAHGCVARALSIIGMGDGVLRHIPCNHQHQIDDVMLQQCIESDQNKGYTPWVIVGSAGTVNTGAIDNLASLSKIARSCGAWFHVDGAFGALAILAPDIAPRLQGVELADSLAMDFHKWGQVPYDAGMILLRDGNQHQKTFSASDAYLQRENDGLAANSPWPCDYGIDLSRGFRALKIWFTLKSFGSERMGTMISHCCELAQVLAARVDGEAELELMAEVSLNIVCFRYCGDSSLASAHYDVVNRAIIRHIQISGEAAPSLTFIRGQAVIRAAIVNHRTELHDVEGLIAATLDAGHDCRAMILSKGELHEST